MFCKPVARSASTCSVMYCSFSGSLVSRKAAPMESRADSAMSCCHIGGWCCQHNTSYLFSEKMDSSSSSSASAIPQKGPALQLAALSVSPAAGGISEPTRTLINRTRSSTNQHARAPPLFISITNVMRAARLLWALAAVAVNKAGGHCQGALNECNGHGMCISAEKACQCFDGWGSESDKTMLRLGGVSLPQGDCSYRVCPAGKAWVDVPTSATAAHALAECSNMGMCDV